MNGLIINNLEQNTPEWQQWRMSGIGGSDAAILKLGNLYGKTPHTLWLDKRGQIGEYNRTEAAEENLERGKELEPKAREYFIKHTGIYVEPVLMQSTKYPFMLASLDGITPDLSVGVEIKAPGEKVFKELFLKGVPDYYYAQIQHQIAVTGARRFYFFAYNEDIAPHVYLQEVMPDYSYIEELIRLEQEFWRHVEFNIPPTGELNLQRSRDLFIGLVMLGGVAKSGKDEIGSIITRIFQTKRYSPSDALRDVHAKILGLSEEEIAADKEKYRPGMVALGDELRRYVPDVWMQSIFNRRSGIHQAMLTTGAVVTSTRYANEVMIGKRNAEDLGVPFRLIYIERPKIKAANDVEGKSLPLVKSLADIVLVNDMDVNKPIGLAATELAVVSSIGRLPLNKLLFFGGIPNIFASSFKDEAKAYLKATRKEVQDE